MMLIKVFYTVYAWIVNVALWSTGYVVSIVSTIGIKDKENKYNSIERKFTQISFRLLGINFDVKGLENIPEKEPVIFVSNHQSLIDVKLSIAAIPRNFSFISKDILFKIPLLGKYMKTSGHIGIRRTDERNAYGTLSEVIKKLDGGKSIIFFPEGTRSENGELGKFKRGISMVILKSGRKVIPTAIMGSRGFLPKSSILSNPGHRDICFRFGKPIEFPKVENENRELSMDVVAKVRSEVSKLLYN
ncbi:1-acyl-sn-glycerol-3-phosphate acyltransferase [Candidatus Peregrinibacteria bacterium]|jgi:1-acyl-sn-glycerol-3-phosphate acyltransferase|nr:1-acyl-sn-glycerol-3-phosphate acyltransferase [Candidatus Scalindua sp.]MBT4936290.1 1-acyl-sn-glycerol-3-phosphate acyltransferase [Candidatus Peregrinibacteria bacterium]MBT5306868.1 1-acyl-sn-glycerol-3-phosphate acyltransferase [Candidatus Scalindua sp.]MBT6047111.1 1-acyl-sn-glycerol-3-phosphate acyltransferase [Candidatus Scalindua sp.]MBT7213187.1 1-acyl-sn-glycerol-3-phosphate acyltransferase [Candidatus Scalindua sp.]